jgi:putative Mg2+ transporter-C (MgtC) family protein
MPIFGLRPKILSLRKIQINLFFRSLIRIFAHKLQILLPMTTDFILRIFIAAILGGIIGLEREYRAKEAGFRTHFLVGLGSGLFMILSAHGFDDVVLTEATRHDVSRIAAQVVSGIGFIGAGCIIFQKRAVRGLTTAAGLWVTSAIGMASGAGMFAIAAASTLMVVVCLELMNFIHHKVFGHNQRNNYDADDDDMVK